MVIILVEVSNPAIAISSSETRVQSIALLKSWIAPVILTLTVINGAAIDMGGTLPGSSSIARSKS